MKKFILLVIVVLVVGTLLLQDLFRVIFVVAIGVLLSDSFVLVPAFHYGVVERFGKRTGRISCEGLGSKLPFIDKVKLISMKLSEIDVTAVFTTQDRLKLTCQGSLQYIPDYRIKDSKGRNVFITISKEIMKSGIGDTIQGKLGALGGLKTNKDFIENRHALADIINCFLRLKTPPHMDHDPKKCGLKECKYPECPSSGIIDAKDLIEFYSRHWALIKRLLDEEKNKTNEHSSTEERYGIDIVYYALSDVAFTEETQKSFEKEQQTAARQKAFSMKLDMAKTVVKELGAGAQVALDAADVSLDPNIKKEVISVEGDAGVLGAVVKGFAGKGGNH